MKFEVYADESRVLTRRTVIEALSLEEALALAEDQDWRTWEDYSEDTNAELRSDISGALPEEG